MQIMSIQCTQSTNDENLTQQSKYSHHWIRYSHITMENACPTKLI